MTAFSVGPPAGLPGGRPPVDVELVLRVKNQEEQVGRLVWQAMSHLQAQAIAGAILIVDCGSVDHTIEMALVTAGDVPVQVISCSEGAYGWMAAATATTSAATIAFASRVERADLLGLTAALLSPNAAIVATTHPASARWLRASRGPRLASRRGLPAAAAQIHLVHMETAMAADLLGDRADIASAEDLVFQCLASGYRVHELRVYEPDRSRRPAGQGIRWNLPRPPRAPIPFA